MDKSQYQWVRVKAEVFRAVNLLRIRRKSGSRHSHPVGAGASSGQSLAAETLQHPSKRVGFGFFDESSMDDETYRDYKPLPKTSAELVKQ